MKIVQINATCDVGSTGKIASAISKLLTDKKIENYVLYSQGHHKNECGIKYANVFFTRIAALISKITGNYGLENIIATKALIKELDKINPDIIHLHNIHNHACNLDMLFSWIKLKRKRVVWTFHDCWAFTAYCPYFDFVNCNRWETGCHHCPQSQKFSWLRDRSKHLYKKKMELFNDLDLTIVTPSEWLAGLVKRSFLREYPVHVINNGIDLSVFHPTKSDFREKYHIPHAKHIILGVAFDWSIRKGIDVFVELAKRLDMETYQIVLVGTNDEIDQYLPKEIITVHRTNNQQELAKIYSAVDLFVNPTREDNYPTVNMEAIACGTPVLTFCTGGCQETVDITCGSVVKYMNIDAFEKEIIRICADKPYSPKACLQRARNFNMNDRFDDYIMLYETLWDDQTFRMQANH